MKAVLAIVFVLALAYASNVEREYLDAFESFKADYGKVYSSEIEEMYRYAIFKQNLDFVNSWDAEEKGFEVAMNSFGDLSLAEFTAMYNGYRNDTHSLRKRNYYVPDTNQVLADDVDWRKQGAVTPVKNQGQCGSCWSFSATGGIEGAHFLATRELVSLSEQNLVDCSVPEGNHGCQGGWMDQAFQYVIKNGGIDTEDSYRYTATGPNACHYNPSNRGATISGFQDVPSGSESGLQQASQGRPVSVAIDASHSSFQLYKSGVYYEPACNPKNLDHGVLVVGYGSSSDGDYWIVKNSWGSSWGMQGYIHMARNKNNNCGIATAASFPTA